MGYIFDALNKNNGETTREKTSVAATSDSQTALADVSETRYGLAALLAKTKADKELDDAAPLRLADIAFSIDTDTSGNTVLGTIEEPEPIVVACDQQDNPFDDQPTTDGEEETADLSIDQPLHRIEDTAAKTSWWNRLLGKHFNGQIDDRLVAVTNPASAMSEEYRSIRTSILARHDNERHLVHTITSATPQEGKTITCVNLGLTFAELRNRTTIIVECDLRLPTFGKLLNCDTKRPGLIDFLRGEARVSEIIQQVEGSALHIIPAGGRVSDEAVQLLSSQRMSQLIQGLRAKYDHVIIDTPPVLQLADAGIVGSQSEEVLVIARMRRTPRPLVEQAINTLTSYNAQVSGIIATDNPRSRSQGYGYKYGYRYGYGYAYGYTPKRASRKDKKSNAA